MGVCCCDALFYFHCLAISPYLHDIFVKYLKHDLAEFRMGFNLKRDSPGHPGTLGYDARAMVYCARYGYSENMDFYLNVQVLVSLTQYSSMLSSICFYYSGPPLLRSPLMHRKNDHMGELAKFEGRTL